MFARPILRRFAPGLLFLSSFVLAIPAGAALQKYDSVRNVLVQFAASSPQAQFLGTFDSPDVLAVIDNSAAPNPILRRFLTLPAVNPGTTIIVPQLSGGFIFIRTSSSSSPAPNQTGTGSTASSIDWGNTVGWTITGGSFCHSTPSFICGFANGVDLATSDPSFFSSNYDVGVWIFHGTGFVDASGFIFSTGGGSAQGNTQFFFQGANRPDGTVPALPLLGLGSLGLSVIALGVASVRRSRR